MTSVQASVHTYVLHGIDHVSFTFCTKEVVYPFRSRTQFKNDQASAKLDLTFTNADIHVYMYLTK